MDFEWDPEKDLRNQAKHGVSFEEASSVFSDPLAVTVSDPRHSEEEFRYVTTGYTSSERLIIVAHADREARIRIITAREAKPSERRAYESET